MPRQREGEFSWGERVLPAATEYHQFRQVFEDGRQVVDVEFRDRTVRPRIDHGIAEQADVAGIDFIANQQRVAFDFSNDVGGNRVSCKFQNATVIGYRRGYYVTSVAL